MSPTDGDIRLDSGPAEGEPAPGPGGDAAVAAPPPWWSHPDRPSGAPLPGEGGEGRLLALTRPVAGPASGEPDGPDGHGAVPFGADRRGRRWSRRWRTAAAVVVVALVAGGIGGGAGVYLEERGTGGHITLPQVLGGPSAPRPGSLAGVAAADLAGVVYLSVQGKGEQATGSGVVLDAHGYILTNDHVVQAGGDDAVTVTFYDGQSHRATVVGRDAGDDLAVVRVTGVSGLRPLTLGDSDAVRVGDPVVAIGAPFGLQGTVTAGIVSAKDRPITSDGRRSGSGTSYIDALQTDAPINPGNSGGPLLDAAGRVVGINTAIRSAGGASDPFGSGQQAGSIGLGFAIPVNQARRVAEQLINKGRADHAVIGVTLNLRYKGDGAQVLVSGGSGGTPVTPGGPAALAGIRPGDVITAADGHRVHRGADLVVFVRSHRPGETVVLTVERGGTARTVRVRLGAATGG